MPTIPTGYAQFNLPLAHSSLNRDAMITFGVDVSAAGGAYLALVDAIGDLVHAEMNSAVASEVTFLPPFLQVGQDGGENLVVQGSFTDAGASTDNMLNGGQALVVKKLTARGGRRGRGRLFFPWCLTEAGVNEVGRLDSGVVTNFQARWDAILTELETTIGGGCPMVLLHSPSGEDVNNPTTPGSPNVVTSVLIDPIVGSQRKRLGR